MLRRGNITILSKDVYKSYRTEDLTIACLAPGCLANQGVAMIWSTVGRDLLLRTSSQKAGIFGETLGFLKIITVIVQTPFGLWTQSDVFDTNAI